MAKTLKHHIFIEETFLSHFEEEAHIYVKHYIPKDGIQENTDYIHFIFQHGMIEYHLRHEEFFYALMHAYEGKIIISVMDLLGHGLSGGHRAYVDKFETYCLDMVKFFENCSHIIPTEQVAKRILGSHSLGGLVALKTITSDEYELPFVIDGLVFVNPCISPKVELPRASSAIAQKIPPLMRKIRLPLIYSAYDLTSDPDKAISFMHDHLISKSVSIKLAMETVRATEGLNSTSYFLKIPSLFILSGDDTVVDIDKCKLFITGMDKKIVTVKNYPKMKHDILNETCRNDVFKEIIKYINK